MGKSQNNNYAFIDSQNLNLSILNMGWRLDFRRFRIYLRDKFAVERAFLFIGFIPTNKKLYNSLKSYGFELVYKQVVDKGEGMVKGNVDAELVLHTMIQYPNYDRAVIVSGDGDFACLVQYLKSKKKLERLIVPNSKKYSSLLRKFNRDIVFVNGLRNKLEWKKRKRH